MAPDPGGSLLSEQSEPATSGACSCRGCQPSSALRQGLAIWAWAEESSFGLQLFDKACRRQAVLQLHTPGAGGAAPPCSACSARTPDTAPRGCNRKPALWAGSA